MDAVASGAYVQFHALVQLRAQARGFSFLPKQPLRSPLSGTHASRLRGRGLDFDELRVYQPGDDVRDIDWKVTARMRKPYTRIYTEERDRKTLLLVDQRVNMFFGSRLQMKSVAAVETAALSLWRILAEGDRPGAIVFSDRDQVEISPQRSQARAMAILHEMERMNRALRVQDGGASEPAQLNRILERAVRLATRDHLVILVSDLDGVDEKTHRLLKGLTRHNDVIVFRVYDPMERDLPEASSLVFSDGDLQLEIDARDLGLRSRFQQVFEDSMTGGREALQLRRIPMLPISSAEPVALQLQTLLGERQSR
jgi:uncharacterized protein (DUF58 family)